MIDIQPKSLGSFSQYLLTVAQLFVNDGYGIADKRFQRLRRRNPSPSYLLATACTLPGGFAGLSQSLVHPFLKQLRVKQGIHALPFAQIFIGGDESDAGFGAALGFTRTFAQGIQLDMMR